MKPYPLVSVVIPTFNQPKLLEEAIQSVLNQSYTNYEIFVVDDGSDEATADCVRKFNEPINLIQIPHNGNMAFVRNQGIFASNGTLIAFLDHDDIWMPEKLSRQVALFEENPMLGMVYTNICFLLADSSVSEPVLLEEHKSNKKIFEHILQSSFVRTSTVMMQKKLCDHLGFFDLRFPLQNDALFYLRAAHQAPVFCISDPLVHIRKVDGSLSNTNVADHYLDLANAMVDFIKSERLTLFQQLLGRRTISRLITHFALDCAKNGRVFPARRFLLKSLWWYPIQRRAWIEFVKTF